MATLKSPIQIKHHQLSNRLVLPPMASAKADDNGYVTDEICRYYDEKTRHGNLGLVIVEHCFVNKQGKASENQLSLASDDVIEGHRKLVDILHRNGSMAIAQINHAGGASKQSITGCEVIGASQGVFHHKNGEEVEVREMTIDEIHQVIHDFVEAAKRVKMAGYDGVEIHSAHGYLLNQFYSPLSNHRCDRFSGDHLDGRIRLHLEIIEGIRKAVGNDFIIALRLGASDYLEHGTNIQDSIFACQSFEKAGVDLIDISGGLCGASNPNSNEQGYFQELSEKIKKHVDVPVILTGGISDPLVANRLINEEKADLIGVGRAILKNSDWPNHAMAINY